MLSHRRVVQAAEFDKNTSGRCRRFIGAERSQATPVRRTAKRHVQRRLPENPVKCRPYMALLLPVLYLFTLLQFKPDRPSFPRDETASEYTHYSLPTADILIGIFALKLLRCFFFVILLYRKFACIGGTVDHTPPSCRCVYYTLFVTFSNAVEWQGV